MCVEFDLALARPVCTFFEAYWQDKFSNNVLPLRVGNDVATIDGVMGVIEILSSRREYTKINPFDGRKRNIFHSFQVLLMN